jgi:putative redox protein
MPTQELPLERVSVTLSHSKDPCAGLRGVRDQGRKIDRIERVDHAHRRTRATTAGAALEIADKCPVHRTLHSEINIRTVRKPSGH